MVDQPCFSDRATSPIVTCKVMGMTSTSPRRKPDGRECEPDRFVAGFAGFFPADAPEFVVVVCFETRRVDGAPLLHQGGWRPALSFADIVRGIVAMEK